MRLYTAAAMRRADQKAAQIGYPSLLLMDTAGRRVAKALLRTYPNQRAVVLCGKGNNGGDGLAAARWLRVWGCEAEVYAAQGQQGDAGAMRQALESHGIAIRPLTDWKPTPGTVLLDALFGTGLNGPLQGFYADLVEKINQSGLRVVAADLPSGLPYTPHVEADLTLALAGLKLEHVFYPHRSACGKILLEEIGMPPRALADESLPELLTPEAMQALLPSRPGNAHKGNVGRVLVVGGYAHYTGAPALSGLAAYRAGAGLVTLAYPAQAAVVPPLEAVRLPLADWSPEALKLAKAEAVAVGMGAGPSGKEAARAALELHLPTLLDADALHPEIVEEFAGAGIPTVITPHPGEAARLLRSSTQEVAEAPLEAARQLAERFAVTVVLKGGPTVVASRRGPRAGGLEPEDQTLDLAVNTTGNPAMAAGGMGDVLSGVIAAFLAAGLSPWDAARLGVYLHGLAGDVRANPPLPSPGAGRGRGMGVRVGLLAHELADTLPAARERLANGGVRPYWR
ncbi:MAG TPA: NAD(P)H-hydrate dehydratase [Meiothermus sp.]|nr:NAD(P)H-hydrate dehydratase [Meiothermus sp.]